jgi:CRISPR-associated protein Csy1
MEYEGLAGVISDYINERKRKKMEPVEKEAEKLSKELTADSEDSLKQLELDAQLKTIEGNFVYHRWLTDAARMASGVSFSTHPIKFTNASAKGASSVFFSASQTETTVNGVYLSTSTLHSPDVDAAYDDAKLSPIAKLLQLRFGDNSLADSISKGDFSALAAFAQSPAQLEEWIRGFKLALSDKSIKSHTLAKQLYFPVGEQKYHLLSPLFSSSMAQAVYQRITACRFGDEVKIIRDAKRTGKYLDKLHVSYSSIALQKFGGSNSQNVSQLNKVRGGKSFLFSSAPPSWQSEAKPPINSTSIFSGEFDRRAWRQARNLQQYLLSIQNRDSTMNIRKKLAAYLDELVDTLFNYAAEVQNLTQFAGWSVATDLRREQQLWLDPYRNDPQFQQERATGDWQLRIADDFAFWLKRRLKHEQLVFGEVEHQEWLRLLNRRLRLLSSRLREFEADLPEVTL